MIYIQNVQRIKWTNDNDNDGDFIIFKNIIIKIGIFFSKFKDDWGGSKDFQNKFKYYKNIAMNPIFLVILIPLAILVKWIV